MNGPLQRVSQGKSLRVIHGGRTLLENDLSLQAAGIRDKAYVHCMVTGVPPTLPSPQAAVPSPAVPCIVYGSAKGFVSYGGFTHVGFPLRTSVSPPTLYPSSLQSTTLPSLSLSRHDVPEFQPQL
jgi:hypothetical protein